MSFSLSTRWNASRHVDGERLIGEIRELGFETVELGHDLRLDLVPGVRKGLAAGTVRAISVHNFCPVPVGFKHGSPDIFSPCSIRPEEWETALRHSCRTLEFAGEVGARWVVLHGGWVEMKACSADLIRRAASGDGPGSRTYEKLRLHQMIEREKKAPRHLNALQKFLENLLPAAEKAGCGLALEIQPLWESVPTELEMLDLLTRMDTSKLRYWHDIGHGQVRENLGFTNHRRWLERLEPFLAGMHVHDVAAPAKDHLAPGQGSLDFSRFAGITTRAIPKVLEPHPLMPGAQLMEGVRWLGEQWKSVDNDVGEGRSAD